MMQCCNAMFNLKDLRLKTCTTWAARRPKKAFNSPSPKHMENCDINSTQAQHGHRPQKKKLNQDNQAPLLDVPWRPGGIH